MPLIIQGSGGFQETFIEVELIASALTSLGEAAGTPSLVLIWILWE